MSQCFDDCLSFNVKVVDFRCISRDEAVNRLNISVSDNKGHL